MLRKEISMCEQNMTVVVGKDEMKIITTYTGNNYYYQNLKCSLTLAILSPITLVAAQISSSSSETFNVSAFNLNSSDTEEFTIRQHEVYTFGPGYLTLRYWKNAYRSASRNRFVIFSSQG
jgi:hypothetical protein